MTNAAMFWSSLFTNSKSRGKNVQWHQEKVQRVRVGKYTRKSFKKAHDQLIFSNGVSKKKTDSYSLFLKIYTNGILKIL